MRKLTDLTMGATDPEAITEPEASGPRSVMVYHVFPIDAKTSGKEPLGVLLERRKADRGNNVGGLLHLARKEFAETEEDAKSIVIGDYR